MYITSEFPSDNSASLLGIITMVSNVQLQQVTIRNDHFGRCLRLFGVMKWALNNSVNFSCVYSFSVTEAAVAASLFSVTEAAVAASLFVHTQMDILDFIRHNCSSKMVTVQFLLNPFFRFESIMNQHCSDQRPLIVIKHGASLHVAQI